MVLSDIYLRHEIFASTPWILPKEPLKTTLSLCLCLIKTEKFKGSNPDDGATRFSVGIEKNVVGGTGNDTGSGGDTGSDGDGIGVIVEKYLGSGDRHGESGEDGGVDIGEKFLASSLRINHTSVGT
ncbi:hypothetical protein Tco_0462597 [Tanacetum coccineum]